jgi:hypothetical protein
MKVLDLFSGLGGFSEAFLRAGDEVVRVENNPLLSEVPNTTLQDVKEMRDRLVRFKEEGQPIRKIDVVLASPPCYDFSLAYSAPRVQASRNGEEWNPSLELIEITLEIIELIQPRWWVIENVVGSARYFEKLGLVPHQVHDRTLFYGKFPKFSTPGVMKTKRQKDSWHGDPLRANKRALIPLELSMALRNAIISQKTLFDDYNIA